MTEDISGDIQSFRKNLMEQDGDFEKKDKTSILSPGEKPLTDGQIRFMNIGSLYNNSARANFNKSQTLAIMPYIDNFKKYASRGLGLYIWGDHGGGKTYASSVLCKVAWGKFDYPSYLVTSNQLRECFIDRTVKAHYDSEETRWYRINTIPFMVIDDIGKEHSTDSGYFETTLNGLLRERRRELRITILTTNIKPSEFVKYYGEPVAEIVKESFLTTHIDGSIERGSNFRSLQASSNSAEFKEDKKEFLELESSSDSE